MSQRYRWVSDRPLTRVHGSDIAPGEGFSPTDAELQSFGSVIEAVDDTPPTTHPDTEPSEPPFDPSEFTVDELRTKLGDGTLRDVEYGHLADAERAGKNRETALKAIEAARPE